MDANKTYYVNITYHFKYWEMELYLRFGVINIYGDMAKICMYD